MGNIHLNLGQTYFHFHSMINILFIRNLIWRFLLKLPENRSSYEALLDQGTHPSFKDFRQKYPIKSDRLAKSMERYLEKL